MDAIKNTGHLCSVYCPVCGKVTDKISFNLLREAGKISASCPVCQSVTHLEYDGKTASVSHHDEAFDRVFTEMTAEDRKDLLDFIRGKKGAS
jgi:transcription elongation factor Elf1